MEKLTDDFNKIEISPIAPQNSYQNGQEYEEVGNPISSNSISLQNGETDESYESVKNNQYSNRNRRKARDPTWLQVEVCREYLRNECNRSPEECKFAHPKQQCVIDNGRVITCYDSLKLRCTRERCKYYHPPKHIKKQIQQLGKSYQKMGYIYNNGDINDMQSYDSYAQYPYWIPPWNYCYTADLYQYPGGYTNFGYYNYYDFYPNYDQYRNSNDDYMKTQFVDGDIPNSSIKNEPSQQKENRAISTENTT